MSEIELSERNPAILRGSRIVLFLASLTLALLVYVGFLIRHKHPLLAGIGILFFLIPFSFFILHLVTNSLRLTLTTKNFTLSYFGIPQTIRWADVRDIRFGWPNIEAEQISIYKRLFVTFRKNAKDQEITIWPILFGISARSLAESMLPYCRDYPKLAKTLSEELSLTENSSPLIND